MISSLKGRLSRVWGNFIELEVGGVGYWVYVGNGFLRRHNPGEEIKIQTHMQVSENDMALYGFDSIEELDLFKLLITVSGVGPKTAAGILNEKSPVEIIRAIGDAEVQFFEKMKGIGKKTAQRVIVDLKSKIGGLGELNLKDELPLLEDDLFLSLKQLGFDRKEIEKVVGRVPEELVLIEDRLGWCLKNIN